MWWQSKIGMLKSFFLKNRLSSA